MASFHFEEFSTNLLYVLAELTERIFKGDVNMQSVAGYVVGNMRRNSAQEQVI